MKKSIPLLCMLLLVTACASAHDDLEFLSQAKSENSLRESSIEVECGVSKDSCRTLNYEIPDGFVRQWSQLFYNGDDVYASLLREESLESLEEGEWCLFKNDEELLCTLMNAGAAGPIVEMVRAEDGILIRYLKLDGERQVQIEELLI